MVSRQCFGSGKRRRMSRSRKISSTLRILSCVVHRVVQLWAKLFMQWVVKASELSSATNVVNWVTGLINARTKRRARADIAISKVIWSVIVGRRSANRVVSNLMWEMVVHKAMGAVGHKAIMRCLIGCWHSLPQRRRVASQMVCLSIRGAMAS